MFQQDRWAEYLYFLHVSISRDSAETWLRCDGIFDRLFIEISILM